MPRRLRKSVPTVHLCVYCSGEVSQERFDTGRGYCTSSDCVARGSDFGDRFRLVLVPKQGFTYVSIDDPVLRAGRSSGKSA